MCLNLSLMPHTWWHAGHKVPGLLILEGLLSQHGDQAQPGMPQHAVREAPGHLRGTFQL